MKMFLAGVGIALVLLSLWIAVSGTKIGLPAAIGFFIFCAGLFVYAVFAQGGRIG